MPFYIQYNLNTNYIRASQIPLLKCVEYFAFIKTMVENKGKPITHFVFTRSSVFSRKIIKYEQTSDVAT